MILVKVMLMIFVLLAFLAVWRIESGWRLVVTPFLFLAYFELFRVLPPFALSGYLGVTDSVLPMLAASIAFGALVAGFLFSYAYRRVGRSNTLQLSIKEVPRLPTRRGEKLGVLVVVLMLVGSGFVLYRGLPPVGKALSGMITGEGDEAAEFVSNQRFALTKAAYFGGASHGEGAIRSIQRVGWAMVICYAMLLWVERRNVRRTLWLGAAVLAGWLFVAGDGTRGPFLNLILMVVAVYSLRRPLRPRTVATLFCLGVGLAILLSLYSNKMYNDLQEAQGGTSFMQQAVTKIVNRVFLANGTNDLHVVDMVNDGQLPLRWGSAHFRDFASAIPGIQYGQPLSYEMFKILNPHRKGTTFLSGTYMSIVYIDFGWYGLIPIFFLIGIVIGTMQRKLLSRVRTHWEMAVMAVVAYMAVTILRSGFSGFLSQLVVITVLVVGQRIAARLSGRLVWKGSSPRRSLHAMHRGPMMPVPAPLPPYPGSAVPPEDDFR